MKTKPEQDKATPRPWRVSQEHEEPEWVVIIGSDLSVVANVNSESGPDLAPLVSQKQPQNENAALIVQAVNEHAALCAVAEAAKVCNFEVANTISAMQDRGCGDLAEDCRRGLRAIQSALAALRKEQP